MQNKSSTNSMLRVFQDSGKTPRIIVTKNEETKVELEGGWTCQNMSMSLKSCRALFLLSHLFPYLYKHKKIERSVLLFSFLMFAVSSSMFCNFQIWVLFVLTPKFTTISKDVAENWKSILQPNFSGVIIIDFY